MRSTFKIRNTKNSSYLRKPTIVLRCERNKPHENRTRTDMAYFWHKGQQIFFSLCKDGEFLSSARSVIEFEYQEDIIRVMKSEVDDEVWAMLLQVLNLETT